MRHHDHNRKFSRETNERRALLRSLAINVIVKGRMRTTEAKAKEIRPYVEKLVTLAKKQTVAARRIAVARLATESPVPVKKLFDEYAKTYAERQGGYMRITKLGPRKSDAAEMAIIEFV